MSNHETNSNDQNPKSGNGEALLRHLLFEAVLDFVIRI
jgi:hypothetical protein